MKISKNISLGDKKDKTFDAIIEQLFSGDISIEDYKPEWTWLVSMDGKPGGDYIFDYDKYCEGEIGERIVVKDISWRIFGEPQDPRLHVQPVRDRLADKLKVESNKSLETNTSKPPVSQVKGIFVKLKE